MKPPNEIVTVDSETLGIVINSRRNGRCLGLVSASDRAAVEGRCWSVRLCLSRAVGRQLCVAGNEKVGHNRYRGFLIHRMLLDAPAHLQVDHINGQPLDNRRCNLRLVTQNQNQWNRSDPKGYFWNGQSDSWKAVIKVNGRLIHLGYFDVEADARAAYLTAKARYHYVPAEGISP